MQKKLHLLFAMMVLMVSSAMAQITTSGMGGKVTADGEELIGARVEATHTPSGTRYVVVTNAKGQYAINGARVGGPYEVKVSYIGFEAKTVKGITLRLGETYRLDVKMEEDTKTLSDVVVTGSASKFAGEKTGAVTNISNEQMLEMPTVSRSITDFTRLSPYGGNGLSFQGSDGRTANFTVDGANFNNNFGLSSALPGGGSPISIDAIEEMQVVISPFDVRQSGFIGGGLNAITKSGTNTFKGTAYVYHQNENMRGNQVAGQEISDARDMDRTTTYGLTMGGPIIKDKLFFFVSGEMRKSPSTATSWRASGDGVGNEATNMSYCSIEDMKRVRDYTLERYGYDTGSYTDFPSDASNTKLLAKLDWNINDKHHLMVRYNYTDNTNWLTPNASSMDGGTRSPYSRVSLYSMAFANSMYSTHNKVNTWAMDLNSRISNDLSNQLLVAFSKIDDIRGSNSDIFPFIDIQDGTGTNTQYMSLGYELFTYNNAVHNNTLNIKDDVTYYLNNHKIMAGLNYEYQMADNQYMRNGTGYYRYASVDDYINGATPEVVALTYGYNGESDPAARVRYSRMGIYAQDDWNATDRLKLTYGLRLDGMFFNNSDLMRNNAIYELDYNGRHIDTGAWPKSRISVSPRIGFTWDVLGDKSLKVRGGTGVFEGRVPLVFFTNMPTNSGMVQYKAAWNAKTKLNGEYVDMAAFKGGLVTDANGKATIEALRDKMISMGAPYTITPEEGTKPSSIAACDPNFKYPQVWKTTLAVDYALPVSFPLSVTVEGIYNKFFNSATVADWSLLPEEGFAHWNGADNRTIFPSDPRGGATKAIVLENTNKGYGWSGNVTINAQPWKWMNLMFSYTHTVKKELTSLPGSDAESALTYVPKVNGPSNMTIHNALNATPDRMIASATLNDKSGNHFSFIYEAWRGGSNYSYMLANDMNGDGYSYEALYIPTDKQVADNEFRFVSTDDRDRFMAYVHSDSYLSSHQGEYAEGYSVFNPWVHRLDFGYKHDFRLKTGKQMHKLQLSADIKNFLNIFNSNWGVSKIMNSSLNSGRILKYEKTDSQGYPVFSTPSAVTGDVERWKPNYAIGQCWYASVGLKYMFN